MNVFVKMDNDLDAKNVNTRVNATWTLSVHQEQIVQIIAISSDPEHHTIFNQRVINIVRMKEINVGNIKKKFAEIMTLK